MCGDWKIPALVALALWFGFSVYQMSQLETALSSHRVALQEMARQYVALEASCESATRIPMRRKIMKGVRCEW